MEYVSSPAFGETQYCKHRESEQCAVVLLENQDACRLDAYGHWLEEKGYTQWQREEKEHRIFAAYRKGSHGMFLNWFSGTRQLQLVEEENSAYFDFRDEAGEVCATPQLTQVFLSDYGLSDLIRLPDGRLILIDGGNVYEKDIDHLFALMQAESEKPVIAAWIFTHPHSDHYYCFLPFMEKYGKQVEIQKLLYNFPQYDDFEHYPVLAREQTVFAKWSGIEHITKSEALRMFREKVAQLQIPVYTPHTGQRYRIGDAKIWFCGSMDDTLHCTKNLNAASLIFTMELAGQQILFGGDGSFGDAKLAERYGEELKCDILQIPHHGFGCGTDEGEIDAYRLMEPAVCLLPVEKRLAYTAFTTYRESTAFLMSKAGVREMRTGEQDQVLQLPYTPPADGAKTLEENFLRGRDDTGARTWIFTDLHTGKEADFEFSVLNTTYYPADIAVELYFENMQRKILWHNVTGPRLGVFRVGCMPPKEEDPEQLWQQLPKNTYFAVRFTSNLPVVISHRNHQPAYRSSVI